MNMLWEVSLADFILVTVVLAGGASWLTGRAVAITWRPIRTMIIYLVLLTAAARFIHYALFEGTLTSLHYFVVDLIILLILGYSGFRTTRARQMAGQYSWLFRRTGPFTWRLRDQKTGMPDK